MTRGQIDATDQLTEMIKMLGNDLGVHLDRLAAAIENQTEAHREMTEYLARAIDSRK